VNGLDDRRRIRPWRLQRIPGDSLFCPAGVGNLTGSSGQFALTSCNAISGIAPRRYHL
jgi:hypothetical protein